MDSGEKFSRGEEKLAGAVQAFSYDFRGKTVLDIGSSTGGFTEFALKKGARKVFSVEKGTNQMRAPLRFDSRVVLMEKTDIFDVYRERKEDDNNGGKVFIEEDIDVVLADVSFVSLREILKHVRQNLATKKTDFLVMLKPQFEAKSFQLNRGVVKNEKMRRDILKGFEGWLRENGFLIKNKVDNKLAGKKGNLERFYFLGVESLKNA